MSILAWFTLRHKHNECSHLLHKHKESDIRKRNELQNEAVGEWDDSRFQNGGRRNSPVGVAALQMPDTFLPTTFLSRVHLFLRLVNVHLPVLTQKVFFNFKPQARIIANCLDKFLVENSILRHHFELY